MSKPIITVSIKGYAPKTYGSNDKTKKIELRDLILPKINNLDDIRKNCRGKRLSLQITFNLFSDTNIEGRKTKDLDNMLKIFCDVLPEYIDQDRTENGLGLIEDKQDDLIFEIKCRKSLVIDETQEGIDFTISEFTS